MSAKIQGVTTGKFLTVPTTSPSSDLIGVRSPAEKTDVANGKDCQDRKPIIAVSTFRNPKRNRSAETSSRAGWFPYYAGFSVGFVQDVISHLNLSDGATILDPWLGAGTTAEVSTVSGLQIRGYDLNPAMLLVSRARTIPTNAARQIPEFTESIICSFKQNIKDKQPNFSSDKIDPLEQWLQPRSAFVFRTLEQSIEANVLKLKETPFIPLWRRAGQSSPLLALFYVALFRSLRHFIGRFRSSNPTWVKTSRGGERVHLSPDRILNRFRGEVAGLCESINAETEVMPSVSIRKSVIDQASSLRLPLASKSIDAVISSPPYCTRIDYVKATLPELAVIGYPNGDVTRRLREMMIGTPTINRVQDDHGVGWGSTCSRFLSAVEGHSSKASSSYYLKYYRQYFSSVFSSLTEIDRVLKKSGKCVLVVQDSYYKEVRNDLSCVFIEMATHLGWSLNEESPFPVRQTLAGVNPAVKPYRTRFHAVESALVFSK